MKFMVKDVMSKEIKSLLPDINAKEALKTLVRGGTSGLPVVDKDGRPVGVFTEKEVLKAILPGYVKDVGSFVYSETSKGLLKKFAGLDQIPVRDVMRTEVPTISEEASMTEASRIMLTKSERRIIVVKDNKAIGVITRCDVVKALAREAEIEL